MGVCKHCEKEFELCNKPSGWMANHSRWCDLNPKRITYNKDLTYARSCITKESRDKINVGVKKAHLDGKYKNSRSKAVKTRLDRNNIKHREDTKELLRKKALASPHRRLKKGVVKYKGILLDSSWELELAKRLDELNIIWVRPEPLPWQDEEGITHNYFPDFYLPDHDLYLDPKNKHAINVQEKKLKILLTTYDNIVILDSLTKCKTYTT